ncbi:DUF1206 domain-containing protein [Nocardioides sp. SYSU DS0663]|uniref:DUF1206 domain-containing protein n=1 Tax=Nocardioides sp. SYSU DS0663 TaxID=3416445 RepID=UPI003F4B5632
MHQTAKQADRSDWMDHVVRGGLVAYGVVYLLVGWLAVQLAIGSSKENASTTGAIRQLAQQPFGKVLVWLVAIGMFVLVLWRAIEAFGGHRDEDGGKRVAKGALSLLKAVLYAAIGLSALGIATGAANSGGGSSERTITARLLGLPFGQVLVGLVGAAVIAYGVSLIVRAWTEKFREHLTAEGKSGDVGTAYIWFGKAGYAAKGIAIGIIGGLFVWAAITHEAKRAGGLDQALQELLQQPFGQTLLVLVGLGIACYGLFTFARARHLSR